MAGNIKGITVEFRGDTTKLDKALRQINKETRSLDTELKAIDRALKFNPSSVELWRQKQETLNKKLAETREKTSVLKDALKQVDSGEIEMSAEDVDKLKRKLIETESKAKALDKQIRQIGSADFKALGEGLKSAGQKMTETGKTLTTKVTAPLVGVGAVAAKIGIDFDSEMSKVAAISGATGDDFDDLRKKAREMGRKTKFSATEAGQGFEYMAMAGWKTDDMLEGIEPILNLATAAGEDLGTTSDIVTDALTGFGLSAKDAGHFADVMAAASSNANTNVSMLGESFKYAAPVAGAMGYKVEDVSIALGLMANSGIKASAAGTSLRTLLTNMAKPTDTMAAAMDTLGVSLDDGHGNMKTFKQVMDDLRKGFGQLKIPQEEAKKQFAQLDAALESGEISQKQYDKQMASLIKSAYGAEGALKAEAAASLAGKTGMSGLMAIVNASDEDYEKLTAAIYECDGATKTMADRMMDNAGGAIIQMQSALSDAAITIADVLSPAIRAVANWIAKMAARFAEMNPVVQKVIVVVLALVAAIGPMLIIFGAMASGLGSLITLFGRIGPLLTVVKGAFTALTTGSLLPIIGVIAAVIAVGVLLYKNWDKIKATAQKVGAAVKKAWTDLKTSISTTLDNIKTKFTTTWDTIKTKVTNAVKNMKESVESKVAALRDWLDGRWEYIKKSTSYWWDTIKEKITAPFTKAKETIEGIVEKIKNLFPIDLSDFFGKIKLPHFSWTWSEVTDGISIPNINVDWYDKGGIFNRPSVIGVGEKRPEFVGALDDLRSIVREESGGLGEITINVYGTPGMDVNQLAIAVEQRLVMLQKQRQKAYGTI